MDQTKNVFIYSTPTCHFCHVAKDFFTEKGVAFTEYNVAEDMERRTEMVNKTGQLGVPVISIVTTTIPEGQEGHEKLIIGFDEGHLRELLSIA